MRFNSLAIPAFQVVWLTTNNSFYFQLIIFEKFFLFVSRWILKILSCFKHTTPELKWLNLVSMVHKLHYSPFYLTISLSSTVPYLTVFKSLVTFLSGGQINIYLGDNDAARIFTASVKNVESPSTNYAGQRISFLVKISKYALPPSCLWAAWT